MLTGCTAKGQVSLRIQSATALSSGELELTLSDGSHRRLAVRPDETLQGLADLDGDGSPEVLIGLGEGASTLLQGIVALDSRAVPVQVLAPAGEPGAGDPWRLSSGASATSASGYRCGAPALVVLHSEVTGPGRVLVTMRSFLIRAGVADPTGPASQTEVPSDDPLARSAGAARCAVISG